VTGLGWLLQPAVFPWAALVLGLCIGSFLNVVIHRLPRMMEREWLAQVPEVLEEARSLGGNADAARLAGEVRALVQPATTQRLGLFAPRSHCPKCGRAVGPLQNVPVLSYLLLRGRCAHCGAAISVRYPVIELLAGAGALYCAWRFGFGARMMATTLFFWTVLVLAAIDQETGFLPDDLTLPLLWVGLLFNVWGTFVPLHEAVLGAAAGYLSLWLVYWGYKLATGKDGMGYGDFKMTAAVGAFLGWRDLLMVILISSVVGAVFGIVQMFAARRGWDAKFKFHFGPYIAVAGLVAMFWGAQLAQRYPGLRPF
jgi:leader peptidase (prepilin peptidase)/N-methyltransferase